MEYYSEEEEQQIDIEQELDYDFSLTENLYNNIQDTICSSTNQSLLSGCSIKELFDFTIENKKPKVHKSYKEFIKEKESFYVPIPNILEKDEELEDILKNGWEVLKSNKQRRYDEEQRKIWEEKNQELIKQELKRKEEEEQRKILLEKAKANKHNWTIPKELRGIKKEVKSKKKNRRRRKNGFRVNKSKPVKM